MEPHRRKRSSKRERRNANTESVASTNLDDSRFSELFTNPEYAIDRTNKRFKKSATANAIMEKSRKARLKENGRAESKKERSPVTDGALPKKRKKKKRGKKKRKATRGV